MQPQEILYHIMDPTGNITALAEGCPASIDRARIAGEIMRLHPEVEQVGFVDFSPEPPSLTMAGGEFCGNASMCAAALLADNRQGAGTFRTLLKVSGAKEPVSVELEKETDALCRASVVMPEISGLEMIRLSYGETEGTLPLVRLEGIFHLIIDSASPFSALQADRESAAGAVRAWCDKLQAPGLGLMFLGQEDTGYCLTPLVFIPGSGTLFWESSCASGSCAAGVYLSNAQDAPSAFSFRQPGGTLTVSLEPDTGDFVLSGSVRRLSAHSLLFSPRKQGT